MPLLLIQNSPGASVRPAAAVRASAVPDGPGRPSAASPPPATWKLTSATMAAPSGPAGIYGHAPVRNAVLVDATTRPSATTTTTVPTTREAPAQVSSPAAGPMVPIVAISTYSAPPTTTTTTPPPPPSTVTRGIVTYYDHAAGTCASPWLPFGTVVRVTNPANGESVSCVVDDREADTARSIDLATATFAEIAPLWQGVIDAELSW